MGDIFAGQVRQLDPKIGDALRLVQITDCHIFADEGEHLQGIDTRQSFAAVRDAVAKDITSLDLLLATGDLSQDGSAESYTWLARQFDRIGLPTFWLPGNHDAPDVMERHFTGGRIDAARQVVAGAWQIVMLDSTLAGEVHGRVSEAELAFLDSALNRYPDRHALVCLHHQAVATGSDWIDRKGLLDAEQLRERLLRHDNLRAVLWGHVHQQAHHRFDGVEWMSTPSSCVQFTPGSREFATDSAAPGYRELRLAADGGIETTVNRVEVSGFDTE
ncbi:MAG: 3',5'-cyclic-AMP phosphodiesterase [Gammaproteobacteria bacterium]|nr:3',5'-cyclic-AMP phosphodiesterase [Gammaproteobacteria bacterium]MDH3450591.1 3',5'-cyclic-AMP phosphodiesterase [Gammaproteobacteria bacterium]